MSRPDHNCAHVTTPDLPRHIQNFDRTWSFHSWLKEKKFKFQLWVYKPFVKWDHGFKPQSSPFQIKWYLVHTLHFDRNMHRSWLATAWLISWMMTSSKWNILCVTGLAWGESTCHWWIPLTKAIDADFCFLWSAPEQTVEQTIETPVTWDAITVIMTSL